MKKYLVIGILMLFVAVAAGGAYWFFYMRGGPIEVSENSEQVLAVDFTGEGALKKRDAGGWLFEYKEPDGTVYSVPLFFSKISMCAWKESSGRCKPEVFVEGRKAYVQGVDIGGGIGVVKLTFVEAPPQK